MNVSDAMIKAVSWTLVHSLWQGIVLAVCAGLIVLATKKSVAALRYNLLSALFVVFLFTVGLTFSYEFTTDDTDTTTRLNLPIVGEEFNNEFTQTDGSNFSNTAIDFLNSNANLIVLLWLLVFAVKLFGIVTAFGNVYRIRNYKTFTPSQYWKDRVAELASQMQIKKSIVLLESALIKIPSVTGFFKPIITVPIGMLSNLPQDQVEAILLHELAHIRRKDYVINLLQHLAEMVFFFNPGLLWLSSLIKDERENCCDDIALDIIGNKTHFVHALISFEEYNNEKLAVAFAGKKNHLLCRVKRIIYNDNKSLNAVEKTFLSVSLLMVAVILIACANPTKMNEEQRKAELQKFIHENARVVDELTTAKTVEELDEKGAALDKKQSEQDEIATAQSTLYTVKTQAEQAAVSATPTPVCNATPVAPVETIDTNTNSVTTRTVTSKTKASHNYEKEVTVFDPSNPKNNKHAYLRTGVSGENLPNDVNVDHLTSKIISELMHNNIIKSTQGLSYMLSENDLIVNGVKQCETVHAKFKNKYVKTKTYTICYNYDYSGDI